MLKNILLSGCLATAFLGVFSTAHAMELPEERELRGTIIKKLLRAKKIETSNERISLIGTATCSDSWDIYDTWTYKGWKNPEGTYTFKQSSVLPVAMAGLFWVEMVEQKKIFEFTAIFETLNP